MFVLARHGEAGKRGRWKGDDRLRPLSEVGRQQAVGLEHTLVMFRAPRLLASPYVRCWQTLEPLSRKRGRMIETDVRLGPDARPSALDFVLGQYGSDDAVLCTHGETIEAVLKRWTSRGLVSLPLKKSEIRKSSTAKGAAWLFVDEGQGWVGHYLRTLHVGPAIDESEE